MVQPLRARVHNGRLVLDEPTDLPEGEVVELVPLDDVDFLDDDEREQLEQSLEEGLADVRAGRIVSHEEMMARLRARER